MSKKIFVRFYTIDMKVENIIEKPYIIQKKQTSKGIKRIEVSPEVEVLAKSKDGKTTKYGVFHDSSFVGYVCLENEEYGVWVDYIENNHTDKYSRFGKIADQIEVEHCLNRGLKKFDILSDATPTSLAFHYNRGKRFDYIEDAQEKIYLKNNFGTFNVNVIIERLMKSNPFPKIPGIGTVPMYMPKDLIKKYIDIIKKYPLLKI